MRLPLVIAAARVASPRHAAHSWNPVSLELLALTALSPLDGRYGRQTAELREVFSEFAFMRERLRVEIEWLIALSSIGLPSLNGFYLSRKQLQRIGP